MSTQRKTQASPEAQVSQTHDQHGARISSIDSNSEANFQPAHCQRNPLTGRASGVFGRTEHSPVGPSFSVASMSPEQRDKMPPSAISTNAGQWLIIRRRFNNRRIIGLPVLVPNGYVLPSRDEQTLSAVWQAAARRGQHDSWSPSIDLLNEIQVGGDESEEVDQ